MELCSKEWVKEMSRLIRDTDLIEWIDMCEKKLFPALSKENGTVKSNLTVVLEAIASTPTAYDVEAVVEELNAKGNEFFAKAVNAEIKGESLFAEICKMAAAAVYESADIVKRGGRNE